MPGFLKSDLTYSLGGGFILGALALFFMQPAASQHEFAQNLSATASIAKHIIS